MNVANVKTSAAVNASSSSHEFLQENVVSEGDVEDTMDWENLKILIQLTSGSWESVQDDTLCWFGLLNLLVDDFDNDLIAN